MGKEIPSTVCSALCPADATLWDLKVFSTQETHLGHGLSGISGPRSYTGCLHKEKTRDQAVHPHYKGFRAGPSSSASGQGSSSSSSSDLAYRGAHKETEPSSSISCLDAQFHIQQLPTLAGRSRFHFQSMGYREELQGTEGSDEDIKGHTPTTSDGYIKGHIHEQVNSSQRLLLPIDWAKMVSFSYQVVWKTVLPALSHQLPCSYQQQVHSLEELSCLHF